MPRWKTRPILVNGTLLELKRLVSFGNSYALVLPKDWVRVHCDLIDGHYWLVLDIEDSGDVTIRGYKENIYGRFGGN